MKIPCIQCKGRYPKQACGRDFCPIVVRAETLVKSRQFKATDFSSVSPTVFVGRYGYPYVNVGVMAPQELTRPSDTLDNPSMWANEGYDIRELIEIRSSLINSRFKQNIRQFDNRFLELGQEIGMASKPVGVELKLKDKPKFRLNTAHIEAPHGPNAKLQQLELTSNPKVHTKVDKVVSDVDLKTADAIYYLFKSGFDENFLSKMLSIGNLGVKTQRRLVPTMWSITACDDTIAKNIMKKIKDYKELDTYTAFFGGYLGNYYLILCYPEVWSYELFETYAPGASWNKTNELAFTTDYEPYSGRKTYAENCAGGFYATRIGIVEHLAKLKRQASVLALRFITGEYAAPLGVWVVREATRKAMKAKPIVFASKELMHLYAEKLVKKKFNYDINNLLRNSVLLKNLKHQRKLSSFI